MKTNIAYRFLPRARCRRRQDLHRLLRGISLIAVVADLNAAEPKADGKSAPAPRVIQFSGFDWEVKDSGPDKRIGPGPNYFSAQNDNVSVDSAGRLHLKVSRRLDENNRPRWQCAEVISTKAFGYGHYQWELDTPIDADPDLIFGLFTWDDAAEQHHREIDIELISTWGEKGSNLNAQYVLQPWDAKGRRKRWTMRDNATPPSSTHSFTWASSAVDFLSVGAANSPFTTVASPLQSWTYDGAQIPTPADAHVHMNLWLLKRPADSAPEPEVIIRKFAFDPPSAPTLAAATIPEVHFESVPDRTFHPGPDGTEAISGTAAGVSPGAAKLIIYALGGDSWYVQPQTDQPNTSIDDTGHWTTRTHGGQEYAALLVSSSFTAAPKLSLTALPHKGGEVLAIARIIPGDHPNPR